MNIAKTTQDVKTDVSQEAEYSSADTHKVLKVSTERGMIIIQQLRGTWKINYNVCLFIPLGS